jgi:hypothetical protein
MTVRHKGLLDLLEGATKRKQYNQQELTDIAIGTAKSLRDFAEGIERDEPVGLWQEIKTLPEVTKSLFKAHVIDSFSKSATIIEEAVKTRDILQISQGFIEATLNIFVGFENFFSQLKEKIPIIMQLTKIAFLFAILTTSPHLIPVASIVADNILTPRNHDQGLNNINKSFNNLILNHIDLADIPEKVQKFYAIMQTYKVPIESLLSLNFDLEQLSHLRNAQETPDQKHKLLTGMSEIKKCIPCTESAVKHFVSESKAEISNRLIILFQNSSESIQNMFKSIFETTIGKKFDEIVSILAPKKNIFDQVANFVKVTESLQDSLKKFSSEIERAIDDKLRKQISKTLDDFIEQKFIKPISKVQKIISSAQTLSKQLGLSKASEMIIRDFDHNSRNSQITR